MKKPRLSEYTNYVLNLLASQYNDEAFDEKVLIIMRKRYLEVPLFGLCYKLLSSKGLEKRAISDVLAIRINEGEIIISDNVLDEIINNVSLEQLWDLGKNDNEKVRTSARERLFKIMDKIEETKNLKIKILK